MQRNRSEAEDRAVAWYAAVRPYCLARLQDAYDSDSGLFARQLRNGEWARTTADEAITSTASVLIALSRTQRSLNNPRFSLAESTQALAGALRRRAYPGHIGLALWANAVVDALPFTAFLDSCGSSVERLRAALPKFTTMEIAWLLSGLLHDLNRMAGPDAARLADETLARLLKRQTSTGLFVHAEPGLSIRGLRPVSNFADQIYSVQALAHSALARRHSDALDAACRCADALLKCRGPLSQWWWHYRSGKGAVARYYPVYSVHQYGMAPMAFQALAAAGAEPYRDLAWPGLGWVERNELNAQMVDSGKGTVWRDIHIVESRAQWILSLVREVCRTDAADSVSANALAVNRETRPYEWAWCLVAEAQLTSPAPFPHLV